MEQQGRCVLPADETGRVLDRLTVLEKIIRPTRFAVFPYCSPSRSDG
jgi:hypothetical protein